MQTPSHAGILWIISAPSGAGKTTLSRALIEQTPDLRHSVSYTTRPPRPGERDGEHYHFVDTATFEHMVEEGAFLEHAHVFGNHYGTGEDWVKRQLLIGTDVLLEIDWQGARQVRERLPKQTVSIFILPPSADVLEARLRDRGQDSEEVIALRTREAQREMMHYDEYDYVVVNDQLDVALAQLRCIVNAERLRLSRHTEEMRQRTRELLRL
ncbi:MAG: guanylate kinase [Pseudomonadota bacterium]|uniref:guanylate kinase n=1 Tax=Thermithiobacillus tepidarius TaxID=929 RepID=UPI0003FDA013|nr:guanylate kinase [Thermithiobacillus tepidarius]